MIQAIISQNEKYTLPEQAQMAAEAGIKWIEMHPGDTSKAEIADLIVPLCREQGIILTLANDPDMAKELGIHGVYVDNGTNAVQLRQDLGPEAIIGTQVSDPQAAATLAASDIDYVCLPCGTPLDNARKFVTALRSAGCQMPVVMRGDFGPDRIDPITDAGINGIAVGKQIFDSQDPVAHLTLLIEKLQK